MLMKKMLKYTAVTASIVALTLVATPLFAVARPAVPMPTAAGTDYRRNAQSEIDFSNAHLGYVKVRWLGAPVDGVRVVVLSPSAVQYQYFLRTDGQWEVFPLSGGNGEYTVKIAEPIGGGRFSVVNHVRIPVTLIDEFAPFLRPNQFVNFTPSSAVVTLANSLVGSSTDVLANVGVVFDWVVDNIVYDDALAQTVQWGYVPDLDAVLTSRRGICFDYAALMAAMLRSQGIPTRLEIGYVGELRHAWISVFSEEHGWVSNIIEFDGRSWRVMDPTFVATGGQDTILEFVGDGRNHRTTHIH